MEARFILEPVIGTVAAEKATAEDVGELENGLMRISRAMMTGGIEKVDEEHRLLQNRMAACTRNPHLERIGRQLAGERRVFCRTRASIQKSAPETLFSACVAIVKAIKHKDPTLAAQRVREHILQDARLMKPADRSLLPVAVRSALEIKPE
jgi:DNA-binding GntR family transcriptional regulator